MYIYTLEMSLTCHDYACLHKLTITLSGLQIFHRIHFWNMESSWRELPGTEFIRMMGWLKYSSHCLQFWMSERRSPLNGWWSCSITRQSIQAWNIHNSVQFSFVRKRWLRTIFMDYDNIYTKYNTLSNTLKNFKNLIRIIEEKIKETK